jgi:hypothetical protein
LWIGTTPDDAVVDEKADSQCGHRARRIGAYSTYQSHSSGAMIKQAIYCCD